MTTRSKTLSLPSPTKPPVYDPSCCFLCKAASELPPATLPTAADATAALNATATLVSDVQRGASPAQIVADVEEAYVECRPCCAYVLFCCLRRRTASAKPAAAATLPPAAAATS